MPTMSFPYNPTNIIKSSPLADDGDFRQWMSFLQQGFLQAGWTEQLDTGYCQPFLNAMAFTTSSNNGAAINTGGVISSTPAQYGNLAMDNSTSTYWQSNGQPVLSAYHPAVGYDSGNGNSLSPIYYNLWLQGAAATTDPITAVLEHALNMDVNYHWAGAGWNPVQSFMNLNTTAGSLSVASVSLSAISGTGYIVNTTATVGTGGGASTTTSATFAIGIGSSVVTMTVSSSASFAVGDYIQVSDGTHTNHYVITALATGTITATLIPAPGDSTSGTMGSGATVIQCGLGAVVQPVVTAGAITSVLVANPGVKYHVGDVLAFQVASAGSGATATVGGVNVAGMIQYVTVSGGGSSYVANPTCSGSGGTGSCNYAVFTNAAIGVGGAVQQVIPCVSQIGATYQSGGGGYAYGTPPTLTIAQASGGSTPSGAGTPTAKLTMSTGGAAQLNRFDICTQFWTTVSTSPVGPTDRAFRLRILQNVSSATSVNIYEFQLYNNAGTYVNNAPYRLAPTSSQTSTQSGWKLFVMQDTNSTALPCIVKVFFGNASTWTIPSLWVQLMSITDGSGNAVGASSTIAMQLFSATATTPSVVSPAWLNGYGLVTGNNSWMHQTYFKGTLAEIGFHIERLQTSAGVDDTSVYGGVALFGYTTGAGTSLPQSIVLPNAGASVAATESYWGALLPSNAGSTFGATQQFRSIKAQHLGESYPLRRMTLADTTGGNNPDGSTPTAYDPYGTSKLWFMDAINCTKCGSPTTNTSYRIAVLDTQS